jgi:hypothetical protein
LLVKTFLRDWGYLFEDNFSILYQQKWQYYVFLVHNNQENPITSLLANSHKWIGYLLLHTCCK